MGSLAGCSWWQLVQVSLVAIPEKSRIKLCVDCHSKQHEVVKAAKANTTSGKEAP